MTVEDCLKLGIKLISTGDKHQDYARVCEVAKDYRTFITGKGIRDKLQQILQRESKEAFEQRVRLTKSTTPAVAASLRQPFNKVVRNDRVRTTIDLKNDGKNKVVNDMVSRFYGSSRKKNKGLNYWMNTRFLNLQFSDPNTWVVIEWDAAAPNTPIQPRPFEVSCEQAVNFFVANDEVKWLFVQQSIMVDVYGKVQGVPDNTARRKDIALPPGVTMPPIEIKSQAAGNRYTLYDQDFSIVFEQVDKDYAKQPGYVAVINTNPETATDGQIVGIQDKFYLVRISQPKIGYAPAFRVGYKGDEETNERTFVNPWHDALCYFEKSLKTVSELDLTMTLHVFPQKFQYVPLCTGESKTRKCNGGTITGTHDTCQVCKGTGWKPVHTSASDAILIPLPHQAKDEDILNLNKLFAYNAPPIDLVKWQNEYVLQLEKQAHQAVYNSQVFVRKTFNGQVESETATANENNYQSVYDTLEPFTEKYSELWIDFVTTFAILATAKVEDASISHDFPADPKMKTGDALMAERKQAADSGVPAVLIESIDDDFAAQKYAGDGLSMQKYRVKKRFNPFSGYDSEDIAMLLTSENVLKESKVLYENFTLIFRELETEKVDFWVMTNLVEQRKLVAAKVQQFMDKLKAQAPEITVDTLREGRPGTSGTGDEGENPGTGAQKDDRREQDEPERVEAE